WPAVAAGRVAVAIAAGTRGVAKAAESGRLASTRRAVDRATLIRVTVIGRVPKTPGKYCEDDHEARRVVPHSKTIRTSVMASQPTEYAHAPARHRDARLHAMRFRFVAPFVLITALASEVGATPRDFTADVRTLYAVGACGDAAPAGYEASVVAAHCRALDATVRTWKANWRDKAVPF